METDRPTPGPPNPARRKLLITAGFVAANTIVLNRLGNDNLKKTTSAHDTANTTPAQSTQVRSADDPVSLADAEPPPPDGFIFDHAITGGRIIDPDSGYDAIANIGIVGRTIRTITTAPLQARSTTDATGLVVAPGFIDPLSYEPNSYGSWFKIGDGVTTNLCMHGINNTADGFFSFFGNESQRPPVHYGGAFDDSHMRSVVLNIPTKNATDAQVTQLAEAFEEGITGGWLGLSIEPEYTPWVDKREITALAKVAASHGLPVFSHIRYSHPGTETEGSLAAIDELIDVGRETGAAVHVAHITSMATHVMDQAISKIDAARAEGLDVTACMYPYDFWATTLASERFAPGWQERFRITYEDLEVAGTGQRLNADNFSYYQSQNKLVAAYAIPEEDVRTGLAVPWIMLGSDAIPEPGNNNHPRASGCFSRLLGRYVREERVLSLQDALAKMTILPARRLEGRCAALRRKGRLQIGADADITIFDPETVIDTSTVSQPASMSKGIEFVFVSGKLVKDRSKMNEELRLGDPIKSDPT